MNFQKSFGILSAVSASLVLSACMEVRAVDPDEKEKAAAPLRVQSLRGESEVRPLDEFNRYQVVLNEASRSGSLWERQEIPFGKEASVKTETLSLPSLQGLVTDLSVEGGRTYRYSRLDPATGAKATERPFEVAVPLDLKLEGQVSPFSESAKILFEKPGARPALGRLVFAPGSVLTTQGRDLEIKARSIVAEKAVIRSFAPDQKAAEGSEMKVDGGRIFIEAEKATGALTFELRGRDGADGKKGADPTPQMKGANGKPGKIGVLKGRSREIQSGMRTTYYPVHDCVTPPVPAGRGERGQKGYRGQDGAKGGDTAELRLKILDSRDFFFDFVKDEGQGGAGGAGGKGGEGGEGGKSGGKEGKAPIFPEIARCLHPPAGEKGPEGERGDFGRRGANGRRLPAWVWKDGRFESF